MSLLFQDYPASMRSPAHIFGDPVDIAVLGSQRQPDRRTEPRHFFTEALRLQHQLQKEHPGMFVLDIAWFSQKYKHYLENLPELAPEEQSDLQKLCNNSSTPPSAL